jgi:hypothetical protein
MKHVMAYFLAALLLVLMALALIMAGHAWACDGGQYYDGTHQICQPNAPAYPLPGQGYQPSNAPYPPHDRGWQQ